ncbi:MAG: universal stress protein [Vulcanimicrobiaceae bacterium]|jgi:nucleotide-binding universal stress UspA family protein
MEKPAFPSILVPVDGSQSADAALHLALRLVAPGGELVLAHVIHRVEVVAETITPYGGDPTPILNALEEEERAIFARAEAHARNAGIRSSSVALDGPPASVIAKLARERHVDAIAMGTHGRRGLARLILGSTAAGVVLEATVPTFVVHEGSAVAQPFRQILVALDASRAASDAARVATDLAAHDGGSVFLAHVAEQRDDADAEARALADAGAYAREAGVPSDAAILQGDPVEALLVSAEACHADLIAIGAHGGPNLPLALGSVAAAIAGRSPIPVLVLPLPAVPSASVKHRR